MWAHGHPTEQNTISQCKNKQSIVFSALNFEEGKVFSRVRTYLLLQLSFEIFKQQFTLLRPHFSRESKHFTQRNLKLSRGLSFVEECANLQIEKETTELKVSLQTLSRSQTGTDDPFDYRNDSTSVSTWMTLSSVLGCTCRDCLQCLLLFWFVWCFPILHGPFACVSLKTLFSYKPVAFWHSSCVLLLSKLVLPSTFHSLNTIPPNTVLWCYLWSFQIFFSKQKVEKTYISKWANAPYQCSLMIKIVYVYALFVDVIKGHE